MKKPLFILVLFLNIGITFISCQKETAIKPEENITSSSRLANVHWLRYDETNCNNPWHFDWITEPTDEQLIAAVKSYLVSLQINVIDIRLSRDKIVPICDDCSCPDGIHYFVRVVAEDDIKQLLELNFYEVDAKVVPPANTGDNM